MFDVLSRFALRGNPVSCATYGNGHINRTYLVEPDAGARYILQRINDAIFRNVPALMRNIALVTEYLRAQGAGAREALRLIPTRNGADFCRYE